MKTIILSILALSCLASLGDGIRIYDGKVVSCFEYDSVSYTQTLTKHMLHNTSDYDLFDQGIDFRKIKKDALRMAKDIDSHAKFIIGSIFITRIPDSPLWYVAVRVRDLNNDGMSPSGFSLVFTLDCQSHRPIKD